MSLTKNNNILVTGGAGYIGSHAVLALNEAGYSVTVLDNLSTGLAEAVLSPAKLIVADLGNIEEVDKIFKNGQFSAVMHFAGSIVVPESIDKPLNYYENSIVNTISLLQAVERYQVPHFIFSSSAAVYGIPNTNPVTESSDTNPINPYGRSKLMAEWIIQDLAKISSWFSFGILRYFNVAGCDVKGRLGQNNPEATHLIKQACMAALGTRKEFQVYGNDYPTQDGTGIRDFIHVSDLAQAHLALLNSLENGGASQTLNCGYGYGYSVHQVVETMKKVSGVDFPITITPRRDGDPPEVVADVKQIMSITNWRPAYADLQLIIQSALDWEKKLTNR